MKKTQVIQMMSVNVPTQQTQKTEKTQVIKMIPGKNTVEDHTDEECSLESLESLLEELKNKKKELAEIERKKLELEEINKKLEVIELIKNEMKENNPPPTSDTAQPQPTTQTTSNGEPIKTEPKEQKLVETSTSIPKYDFQTGLNDILKNETLKRVPPSTKPTSKLEYYKDELIQIAVIIAVYVMLYRILVDLR
ncbi:MAG: hypothetical protein QM535_20995 [Limnohabitans sp.]|nr:hypothetical protein [Limnohabitans sp.]